MVFFSKKKCSKPKSSERDHTFLTIVSIEICEENQVRALFFFTMYALFISKNIDTCASFEKCHFSIKQINWARASWRFSD